MFRLLIILLLFPVQEKERLKKARDLFFSFEVDKQAPARLERLVKNYEDNPLFEAYLGVSIAAAANQETSPVSRYNKFTEGKKLVENAIDRSPENPEIRFIRLSIQSEAPAFLVYNNDIDQDKEMILRSLNKNHSVFADQNFRRKVLLFLRQKVYLTPQERFITTRLMNQTSLTP